MKQSPIFYKAIRNVQTNTLFVQVPLSYFLLMYLCTIKIADDQTNVGVFISGSRVFPARYTSYIVMKEA